MGKAHKLSALKVEREKQPGMYSDGNGLYLQITTGGKSWIFRYRMDARDREMGLGSYLDVSLLDARAAAVDAHRQIKQGIALSTHETLLTKLDAYRGRRR